MIWILMPEQIDGPMKSPIVFLQTLLFTWESVWKKNESQKSSILEIFQNQGNQKSNEMLICPFKGVQNGEQSSCNNYLDHLFYFTCTMNVPNCLAKIGPFWDVKEKIWKKNDS